MILCVAEAPAPPSPRQMHRQQSDERVAQAFIQAKQRYGAPRLTQELREAGYGCNRKTVAASLATSEITGQSGAQVQSHDKQLA